MIEITQYDPSDFSLLAGWWKSRLNVDLSPDLLSEDGYIAVDEIHGPICAMFLYPIKGSAVCWTGWPISDPESPSEARSEAMDALMTVMHQEASRMGYKLIWTTSGVPAVQERLEKHGYLKNDENITQYWKKVD